MIALHTLRYLATQKFRDAEALLSSRRYNGAVYMMGYALEFSLKRKLSQTLGFTLGFPETTGEMNHYYSGQLTAFNAISTGITLTHANQIRNHKIIELVKFSGAESRIIASYYSDWLLVCQWNPEKRYKRQNWSAQKASDFIDSAKVILQEIS